MPSPKPQNEIALPALDDLYWLERDEVARHRQGYVPTETDAALRRVCRERQLLTALQSLARAHGDAKAIHAHASDLVRGTNLLPAHELHRAIETLAARVVELTRRSE